MSVILIILGTIVGWLAKAVGERVIAIVIPDRIPRRSLLDRLTRGLRGFILVPRGPVTPSTDGVIEMVTDTLVETDPNPGFASFALFDGRLTEFVVSRRAGAIASVAGLVLPVCAFGPPFIGFIIVYELAGAFGPGLSSWTAHWPEWAQNGFFLAIGIIVFAALLASFMVGGKRGLKIIDQVQYVVFAYPLFMDTVVLSSFTGTDRRRAIIAKGGHPSQAVGCIRLGQHRNFETLLVFSPDKKFIRRIRLPTISKNILRVLGEEVSLLALAEKLSKSHEIPLAIHKYTKPCPIFRKRPGPSNEKRKDGVWAESGAAALSRREDHSPAAQTG